MNIRIQSQNFTNKLVITIVMLFLSITATATPINGSFRFGGMFEISDSGLPNQIPNFSLSDAFFYTESQWNSQTGDYVGIHYGPSGTPRRLRLSDVQIPDFWGSYVVISSSSFRNVSFDVTSIEFTITSTSFLAHGTAIAYMTGFEPTIATWQTTSDSTTYWEFTHQFLESTIMTATGVPVSVPESSTTAGMLGVSFFGLACLRSSKKSGILSVSGNRVR